MKSKAVMCPVTFEIIKETEKAFYCCTQVGEAANTTYYHWIPKSVCEVKTFVATYNALGEPDRYAKTVTAVASWFLDKNHIG